MDLTEKKLKECRFWDKDDEKLSGSFGTKSKGLAQIDWRFSDLAEQGRFIAERRNRWRTSDTNTAEQGAAANP